MRKLLLIIIPILIAFLGVVLYLNWPKEEANIMIPKPEDEIILTSFDFSDLVCESDTTYYCIKTIKDVSIYNVTEDLTLKTIKSEPYLDNTISVTNLTTALYWGEDSLYTATADVITTDSLNNYINETTIDILSNRYVAISYLTYDTTNVFSKSYDIVDITTKQVIANLGIGKIEIMTLNGVSFEGDYYSVTDDTVSYYTYACDQTITGSYSLKEMTGTLNNGVFETEMITEYNNTNSTVLNGTC